MQGGTTRIENDGEECIDRANPESRVVVPLKTFGERGFRLPDSTILPHPKSPVPSSFVGASFADYLRFASPAVAAAACGVCARCCLSVSCACWRVF